ncbi:hypothetical protein HNR29_005470 [Rhizobium leguminosarum]|nr:hypothetical protein [Rhizobium leguminosarum]
MMIRLIPQPRTGWRQMRCWVRVKAVNLDRVMGSEKLP